MANFTKMAIQTAFIQLLNERPMNKITVKDITDSCGINRNSFYYHYQDMPALLEEVLMEKVNRLIKEHPSIGSVEECLLTAADFAVENKRVILHIFNSVNRDMFEQYLWHACRYSVNTYFATALTDLNVSEEDRGTLIRYHTCECFGLVIGWLNDGMREDIKPFLRRICEIKRYSSIL